MCSVPQPIIGNSMPCQPAFSQRSLLGKSSCIIRISACMLFTTRPAFPSLTSSLKAGLIWGSCTCLLSKGVPGRGDALWYCHGAAKGNVILHRGFKT